MFDAQVQTHKPFYLKKSGLGSIMKTLQLFTSVNLSDIETQKEKFCYLHIKKESLYKQYKNTDNEYWFSNSGDFVLYKQ